jgi:SCY1-like protein 1
MRSLFNQVRQKMIASAFLRALKDPFPPARQAGILGMVTTQNFFTLNEIGQRLLPAMCSMTRDPEKSVRDQVMSSITREKCPRPGNAFYNQRKVSETR